MQYFSFSLSVQERGQFAFARDQSYRCSCLVGLLGCYRAGQGVGGSGWQDGWMQRMEDDGGVVEGRNGKMNERSVRGGWKEVMDGCVYCWLKVLFWLAR